MLQKELIFIRENLKNMDKANLSVSKATVGWHLDHSLKVINEVLETLKNSNPLEYQKKFNLKKKIIFAIGKFPRGKVKAPKRVLPPATILDKDIENQLDNIVLKLSDLSSIQENQFFTHPIFHHLNKKETLKFLGLHTNHHLKIVKDILK